ncbi:MAG: LEA type 2 family protein [Thiobacillus sp.]|uniref:LEA type 2 family protein n=1 Tax=Thiobacillus sp. TaxID=924 RepID=UPI002732CBAA|nr:LEA type 2 family protein [Thiobacillus sp.]MDP3585147.1 LEA type 2 family protein [Thiobacillus sp.]
MRRLWVLLVMFSLAACSGLPLNMLAPRVSVATVDLRQFGVLEQHFDVGLRVANPNDFDLTIEALEFDLEVNGRAFAKSLSRAATKIPAASSAVLQIDAIMQSKNLIEQLRTLTPDTLKQGVAYRIRGRIKTDQFSRWLPFDHSGVYGGDTKPPTGQTV